MMSVELKLDPMWPGSGLHDHEERVDAAQIRQQLRARDRIRDAAAHRAKHLARHERQRVVADECSVRKIFLAHTFNF
jgi:hypothetical protein